MSKEYNVLTLKKRPDAIVFPGHFVFTALSSVSTSNLCQAYLTPYDKNTIFWTLRFTGYIRLPLLYRQAVLILFTTATRPL